MDEDSGHLVGTQILTSKDEHADVGMQRLFALVLISPDSLIFGQYDPSAAAGVPQPLHVRCILREMIVERLDGQACCAKSRDDMLAAQAAINKKT